MSLPFLVVWPMAKTVLVVDDDPTQRRLMQAAAEKQGFRARVVDVDEASIVIEVTGTPEKIGKFELVLKPYGIIEITRTGSVAMARGHEALTSNPPLVRATGGKEDHHAHDNSGISMSV